MPCCKKKMLSHLHTLRTEMSLRILASLASAYLEAGNVVENPGLPGICLMTSSPTSLTPPLLPAIACAKHK